MRSSASCVLELKFFNFLNSIYNFIVILLSKLRWLFTKPTTTRAPAPHTHATAAPGPALGPGPAPAPALAPAPAPAPGPAPPTIPQSQPILVADRSQGPAPAEKRLVAAREVK